jgi:predicted  nucleic acid-binding Zn-ribbon protein
MVRPSPKGIGARIRRMALAWSLGLLVGLGVASAPALAQDREPLTPAAIAAFEQQLTGARAAQADTATRMACFDQQSLVLKQRRDQDQVRLGELVGHRNALAPELTAHEAEYRAFETTRDAEQARLNTLDQEMARLRQRRAAQENALAQCKADFWTPNFMCDLAYGMAHLMGLFVDNEQQIVETQRRLDNAIDAAEAAERRYRESKAAFDANEIDAAATTAQINAAETSLKNLLAALTALETNSHDSKLLLDAFDDALNEARRVDTADGQARTARAVRGLAVRIDEVTGRSGALQAQAQTTLTEHQLRSCL